MKKSLFLAAAVSAATLAAPASANGLYMGLNAGWNATNSENNATTLVNQGGANALIQEESETSVNGPAYAGVLGFKMPISTGFVAVEANIGDSSAESESSATIDGTVITRNSITSDLSYGITGILATEIRPQTYFYGLAGYQMTTFEGQYTDRDVFTNNIASSTREEDFGGARIGAGIETALTDALSLRVEWTQTYYSEETLEFDTTTSSQPISIDVKPTETRVTLGIIGHF